MIGASRRTHCLCTGRALRREITRHQPERTIGHVVGHEPDVHQSIDVGGAAAPLQVERDDLVALRQ